MMIETLKNTMIAKRAGIIARGPSILNLNTQHFDNIDVLIVLNKSILNIRNLNIDTKDKVIFYMAKDAEKPDRWYKPTCTICDYSCSKSYPIAPEILLVHEHESKMCFPDYPLRYTFDNIKFGMPFTHASICSSIHILSLIGIKNITFFCFDAMVNNDNRETIGTEIKHGTYSLKGHLQIKKEALECIKKCNIHSVHWVTP
jgi:E3 ubiquitin-protein ligase DOA10